ncbi:MAG: sensor histidine kinase [Peptostreptococcaceae bacterium]|nr:sensor histidine kinase [Peptostreptococcaceae bacterium]
MENFLKFKYLNKYRTIRFKMIILNLILFSIMFFSLFYIISNKLKINMENRVYENNTMVREIFQDTVVTQLNELEKSIQVLSLSNEVRSMKFENMDELLRMSVEQSSLISQIFVIDSTGNQFYKTSYLDTLGDRSDREYFKKAFGGQVYYSNSIISRSTKTPISVLAMPIFDIENPNKIVGVLGASIDLDFLSNLAEKTKIGEGGYGYVVDRRGIIIAHPRRKLVEEMTDLSHLKPVEDAKRGFSGTDIYMFEGTDKLTSYGFIEEIGWGVFFQIPKNQVFKNLNELLTFLQFVIFGFLLLIIFISIPVADLYIRPIEEIVYVLKNLKSNNFIVKFKRSRNDEIGTIQQAIKSMGLEIKKHNDHMGSEIDEKTQKLANANKKILEMNKMASINMLSKQLSHKLNTPIGNILTSASFLKEMVLRAIIALERKKMTKEKFIEFLNNFEKTSILIYDQVTEATRIMDGFKDISIERFNEKPIFMDLELALGKIKLKLYKEIDYFDHIEIASDFRYNLYTYPRLMMYILEELIRNSMQHGFVEDTILHIEISLEKRDNEYVIMYRDDGLGMDDETRVNIFEPFSKQKMATKNLGIGMNIVYNLVNNILDGDIKNNSLIDYGAEFEITIPIKEDLSSYDKLLKPNKDIIIDS